MPTKVGTPEEWFQLTGERGSVYVGPALVRRPKPAKKSQEVFLCPHCLETLSSPTSSVLHCAPCDKTWENKEAR